MDDLGRAVDFSCPSDVTAIPRAETGVLPATLMAIQERRMPSFFIVGPPRTGSSWLHSVLSQQASLPQISKETRFFDTHFHRGVNWYLSHFEKNPAGKLVGEVAPTYFACAEARQRMAKTVPQARIVCVFRNPVDRVVSLYRLKRAYGMIPWEFEVAIEKDAELVESGKYASYLKQWQMSFGPQNVLGCIYDDLRKNPQQFLDEVVDFIGVGRFPLAEWQEGLVHDSEGMTHPKSYYRTRSAILVADWFKARRLDRMVIAFKKSRFRRLVLGGGPPFPTLSIDVLRRLHEVFRPEVEELEGLLGRDLSSWKLGRSA